MHREYYVNDAGRQLDTFAASLLARVRGEEPPEDGYHGDYLVEMADQLRAAAAATRSPSTTHARGAISPIVAGIREELESIGVVFDTLVSPSSRCTTRVRSTRCSRTCVRRGVVFEQDGATWLRTTDFGDTRDRVLVRSDGSPTYLLADIAYHRTKFERGWTHLIDIWGADHHGQVKSLQSGMEALGYPPGEPEVLLGQLVKLMRGGEPVRLSKRTGDIVTLADILDEVDPDVARLTFLLAGHRHRADLRPRRRHRAVDGQPRVLRAVRARPDRCRSAGVPPRLGVTRLPILDASLAPLVHEREVELMRALGAVSRRAARRRRAPCARTVSPRGCATSPSPSTASTATAGCCPTTSRSRKRGSGSPRRADRARRRPGDPRSARARRDVAPRRGRVMAAPDAPLDLRLLPRRAAIDDDGRLLDRRRRPRTSSPTHTARPCTSTTRTSCATAAAPTATRFGDRDVANVSYASKAFLCTAMAALVAEEGLDLDVASGGEAHVALRGGFPAERMVFHGNNKSDDELRLALSLPVGRLVIDGTDELDRVEALVAGGLAPPRCCCASRRGSTPTPTSTSRPAAPTRSSGSRSRPASPRDAAIRAATSDRVDLVGFHCHIGSQLFHLEGYDARGRGDGELARRGRRRHRPADPRAQPRRWAGRRATPPTSSTTSRRSPSFATRGARGARGRVRAGTPSSIPRRASPSRPAARSRRRAGVTLYRVGAVKPVPGGDPYVAVDGGMSDNPRPITYGARYEAFLPARAAEPRPLAGDRRRQALRAGRPARAGCPAARRGARSATCSPPRSPGRTRTPWRRTTTCSRVRPWCSCAMARPGSSSAGRPSTTSCRATCAGSRPD